MTTTTTVFVCLTQPIPYSPWAGQVLAEYASGTNCPRFDRDSMKIEHMLVAFGVSPLEALAWTSGIVEVVKEDVRKGGMPVSEVAAMMWPNDKRRQLRFVRFLVGEDPDIEDLDRFAVVRRSSRADFLMKGKARGEEDARG